MSDWQTYRNGNPRQPWDLERLARHRAAKFGYRVHRSRRRKGPANAGKLKLIHKASSTVLLGAGYTATAEIATAALDWTEVAMRAAPPIVITPTTSHNSLLSYGSNRFAGRPAFRYQAGQTPRTWRFTDRNFEPKTNWERHTPHRGSDRFVRQPLRMPAICPILRPRVASH
jgi:hypothetical protein